MANSYTDANGVFRNKLGITDAEQLKRTEYDLAAQRGREILEQNALGSVRGFGLERQQAIHKHLMPAHHVQRGIMNKSNNASTLPLNSSDRNSVNPPSGKPKDSPPSTAYTVDQWMQNMLEGCKRLNSDEAYRQEVAKRQF